MMSFMHLLLCVLALSIRTASADLGASLEDATTQVARLDLLNDSDVSRYRVSPGCSLLTGDVSLCSPLSAPIRGRLWVLVERPSLPIL
jgi:hypothetical protein